jgi:AbrB family looped-hinge helix DNA binding protein
MAKVTSKLQVTIPKALATQYGIRAGQEVAFVEAGDSIRLVPEVARLKPVDVGERLALFDQATRRQERRDRRRALSKGARPVGRGWSRADLYERGRAR